MDVRCERCRAQYVVDDARVSEAGVKVACTQCGHGFLLRKKTLAVTVPLKGGDPDVPVPLADLAAQGGSREVPGAEAAPRSEWRLRQAGGAVFPFRELSTLQRWIVERKASRDDEVAAAGEGDAWRRLGDIPELQSFFGLLEKARRRAEANPEAAAEAPPGPVPSGSRGPRLGEGPGTADPPGDALRVPAPSAEAASGLGGAPGPWPARRRRGDGVPAPEGPRPTQRSRRRSRRPRHGPPSPPRSPPPSRRHRHSRSPSPSRRRNPLRNRCPRRVPRLLLPRLQPSPPRRRRSYP